MTLGIHGAHVMRANDFGDPLIFHLAPPKCNLSNTLVYDQIHAKLMTFAPASALFSVS